MNPVAEVLERAKQKLAVHGWKCGSPLDTVTGAVCAMSAVDLALGTVLLRDQLSGGTVFHELVYPYEHLAPTYEESSAALAESPAAYDRLWNAYRYDEATYEGERNLVRQVLNAAAQELSGGEFTHVEQLNDHTKTSLQDVLNVFNRAIEYTYEQESK